MRLTLPFALALLAGASHAQDVAWKVPTRGVVEFDRELRAAVLSPVVVGEECTRVVRPFEQEWRWVERRRGTPAEAWFAPEFDDTEWSQGRGGFADQPDPRGRRPTLWKERYLFARTTFDNPLRKVRGGVLYLRHDDEAMVYLNGQLIGEFAGVKTERIELGEAALASLKKGRNVLAVLCINTGGAGILEVGVSLFPKKPRLTTFLEAEQPSVTRAEAVAREIFPGFRAPALLFEGELDAKREQIRMTPVDVRDLGWYLALDVRNGVRSRSVNETLHRTWKLGDLRVRGKQEAADVEGVQRLTLSVEKRKTAALGDPARFLDAHVEKHIRHDLEGTIEIVRRLDRENGGVLSFDYDLQGVLTSDEGEAFDVRHAETWTRRSIRPNRDKEFRTGVTEAIAKAAEFLRKSVRDLDAGPIKSPGGDQRSYGSGTLALSVLAMIKGGIPHADPTLVAAMDALRERKIIDTYSLACVVSAFEAFYAPVGEREDLLRGAIDKPYTRRLSDQDRKLMQGWVDQILANTDQRHDNDDLLRFNYVAGDRFDTSVNQYGLLGLYAARLCGLKVDPQLWRASIEHSIDAMERPRGDHAVDIRGPEAIGREDVTGGTVSSVPVAGWGYYMGTSSQGVRNPIYGSMGCAGITALAIAIAGLRLDDLGRDPAVRQAETAMRSGYAWLSRNFTVRWNPGAVHQLLRHYYYYLYGMERSCELSGVALIDGRDWYFEAATLLMATQRDNGSWGSDLHHDDVRRVTAMALLVLKKESMPVLTGR